MLETIVFKMYVVFKLSKQHTSRPLNTQVDYLFGFISTNLLNSIPGLKFEINTWLILFKYNCYSFLKYLRDLKQSK